MQFFGEKYGTEVRVVQIGGHAGKLDGYSMELCGGTHVLQTSRIGLFKIVSEGAIAAGVRRIEALAGLVAFRHLQTQLDLRSAKIDELNRELLELRKALEKERTQSLQREAEQIVAQLSTDKRVLVEIIEGATADRLQFVVNLLKAKGFNGVAILFGRRADQIHLLVTVDPSLTKTLKAVDLMHELTAVLAGKGGGRADIARGVGKDQARLELAKMRALELTAGL
jgi:alanyl-tRNA synthetase